MFPIVIRTMKIIQPFYLHFMAALLQSWKIQYALFHGTI